MVQEYNQKAVGNRIKTVRTRRKITQFELASSVGVSKNYISELECGKKSPSADLLFKLSYILNVSTDYILKGGESEYIRERSDIHEKDIYEILHTALMNCEQEVMDSIAQQLHTKASK